MIDLLELRNDLAAQAAATERAAALMDCLGRAREKKLNVMFVGNSPEPFCGYVSDANHRRKFNDLIELKSLCNIWGMTI